MKRIILKVLLILGIIIMLIVGGGYIYLKSAFPKVGTAPDIKVEITPERVERGQYLANHVALCMDCHAERDWGLLSAPPIRGTEGGGGEAFLAKHGMPGNYYASNITPAGIGDYTDGELLWAITAGVRKDGSSMFPIMPYLTYGQMDLEDIYSIIAYIRTLEPIQGNTAESISFFPMNLIINMIPKEPEFKNTPPKENKIAYGEYLSQVCKECHTPSEKGRPVEGMEFAGNFEFPLPLGGTVRSANLTPDDETGIGKWTEAQFLGLFKQYADSNFVLPTVQPNEFNTTMPWLMLAAMEEYDLSAIYAYLNTLKPIPNKVEKFTPAIDK